MKIPNSKIKIGDRFRKDLGNIVPLVESIKWHGLLQPVVVSENNELICGRRRIEACTKIGETEIEANIISLQHSDPGSESVG